MLEIAVLALFTVSLFLCVGLNISILIALVFGFFLLFFYGIYKKHSAKEMFSLAFSGIKTVKNILINFVLIGIITAVWRAGGTIPYIVYHATAFCNPHAMVLICFLLCALISFLTGTAFGTSATMGVICITIANSMGIPILYSGGAVLSGAFWGDRCSPMSTSALLISELTKTNLFRNIAMMFKTAFVPLVITCAVYALMGLGFESDFDISSTQSIFTDNFNLHPVVIIPAVVIIVFSLFKINVKITMSVSILCGVAVCAFVQHIPFAEILNMTVFGYTPEKAEVAALLSGGGMVSMARAFLIVCISACYSGMFEGTGLLRSVHDVLMKISRKLTPFGGVFVTSILSSIVSCNQTLAIMLAHQLCGDIEKDGKKMAYCLENTAVVMAPLVPWSIAATVPLTSIDAPSACILTACYLYLIPLWNFAVSLHKHKKDNKTKSLQTV
ncbi:MAG: sodium:proton antiporter [Clostridia bacterium]|nr:sodium:proton antiporter [Clostridia bacterium]